MTRRTEVVKLDEGYLVKGWAKTEAEAARLQFALVGVPTGGAALFSDGTAVAEEPWPSDETATTYPPNCDGLNSPEPVSASNSFQSVAEALAERTEGDE